MRPRPLMAVVLGAAAVLSGCAIGAATTPSPLPTSSPSPEITPMPSPSAASIPATLIGTWEGLEDDANSGETWQTTYRLEACRQHDKPWKPPADDQRCGEWTGDATIEGLPAHCTATLYWLEQEGDDFLFLATGPGAGSTGRSPIPTSRSTTAGTAGTHSVSG